MAWTSPRTWVAGEVPTAALLNTYLRDNQTILSGHGHTGSAGDGTRALKPQTINLVATGTPSAPGTGTMILYGSADRVHLRSSSTVTSMQELNHEHTLGHVQDVTLAGSTTGTLAEMGTSHYFIRTIGDNFGTTQFGTSLTVGGTGSRAVVSNGVLVILSRSSGSGSGTVESRLLRAGTVVSTNAITITQTTGTSSGQTIVLRDTELNVAAGAYAYTLQLRRVNADVQFDVIGRAILLTEVKQV
jgi:hypothetical protein